VVFQQILVDGRSSGDLVGQAPHGNAADKGGASFPCRL